MAQVLGRVLKDLQPKGFEVVGAGFTEEAMGHVPIFVESIKHAFPVGYIERAKALEYVQMGNDRGALPMMVFLDRGFNIRAQIPQYDRFFDDAEKSIRAKVAELLAEPGPKALPQAKQ